MSPSARVCVGSMRNSSRYTLEKSCFQSGQCGLTSRACGFLLSVIAQTCQAPWLTPSWNQSLPDRDALTLTIPSICLLAHRWRCPLSAGECCPPDPSLASSNLRQQLFLFRAQTEPLVPSNQLLPSSLPPCMASTIRLLHSRVPRS